MTANPASTALTTPSASPLFSTLASDPDMSELIQMFVEEMPQRVSLVEAHWRGRNFDELRRIAHQLKGACGGYGFPSVGQAAGTLEARLSRPQGAPAIHPDLDSIAQQVQDLVDLCRRITSK